MKTCLYCAQPIPDQARFCQYCGFDQSQAFDQTRNPQPEPPAEGVEPTQPLHPRGTTARFPAAPPPAPYPASPAPDPAAYPPAPAQQPFPTYAPPPPPPLPGQPSGTRPAASYRTLIIILGLVFACALILAVGTVWSAAAGGANRLSTQVADIFQPGDRDEPGFPPPATEIPAAPTPWPTFTPEPQPVESTPQAGVKILSPECSAALDHLSRVSQAFSDQPTTIFDAEWRAETGQALAEMKAACGTLESASPIPGELEQLQRSLDLTTNEYDEASRLLKEGIDERNPGKIWQSVQHYRQAILYLNQAMKDLREFGQ